MKLDAEQRRVARAIARVAREVGASPKQVKAAYQTGLVEANLRNPSVVTDHDSLGWRQERQMYYKDPLNLDASIRRFYKETGAVKGKYGRAGDLAAAVQRPAAQYRGRYEQRSAEADRLMRQFWGRDAGKIDQGGVAQPTVPAAAPTVVDPAENRSARALAVHDFLKGRGDSASFVGQMKQLQPQVVQPTVADTVQPPAQRRSSAPPLGGGRVGGGPLLELFWQGPGGVNVKNGRKVPQGFVSGHDSHVHVASGPETTRRLGRLAQQMGLRVGENKAFGGVAPVHVKNSNHYADRAIDVSGDPAKMRAFAHRVARMYGVR